MWPLFVFVIVGTFKGMLQAGHDIVTAFPPNADEILPWRITIKMRPPVWRVQKLGCLKHMFSVG